MEFPRVRNVSKSKLFRFLPDVLLQIPYKHNLLMGISNATILKRETQEKFLLGMGSLPPVVEYPIFSRFVGSRGGRYTN